MDKADFVMGRQNTETEQIKVLNNLHLLLYSLDTHVNQQIILAEDFNLLLDTTLEALEIQLVLKRNL